MTKPVNTFCELAVTLKALALKKAWGVKRAAGYLRNKGVPVERAARVLAFAM